MTTQKGLFLSNYVQEVLVEFGRSEEEEGILEEDIFVTGDILLKWEEILIIFGNLSDDFNILQQSTEWYQLVLRKTWKVVHNVGESLLKSTTQQRTKLWKMCENLKSIVDLENCFSKFISNSPDSKFQVLLILTSSLEQFLGSVYLTKGKNVPFLLRDLLLSKELLSIFGRTPITFTQLLVGCPRGMNARNVAWHGFLSCNEIHTNLVASLFVLFASLNVMVKELKLNAPGRNPVKLNWHSDQLMEEFPTVFNDLIHVTRAINTSSVIPDSQKVFWQEALRNYANNCYHESLIVLLPLLEHLLRIIYCAVNSCPDRLLTAEATDLYTTLDEILAPSIGEFNNKIIDFLGRNLIEILEDVFCYTEGPRLRDKISHGEFNLFDKHNFCATKVFCNHICCVGLSILFVASQKSKLCSCNELKKFRLRKELKYECECDEHNANNMNKLSFLEPSLIMYKSKFHPVSYLLRSSYEELNKLMLWNELPRPCQFSYISDTISDEVSHMKMSIIKNVFNDISLTVDEFVISLKNFFQDVNCLTLHRPRNEGILVTLMRHIISKLGKLDSVIKESSATKYKQWKDRKMRSRARQIYQAMLQFLPSLQTTLACIVFIILNEIRLINEVEPQWQEINRFLKYVLKYIENILSYCSLDRNQWQEVIKYTSEFTVSAYKYIDIRYKSNCSQ